MTDIADMAMLPSNMISHMVVRLTYLHLSLDHAKEQGQGHVYFDYDYQMMTDMANVILQSNMKWHVGFRLAYLVNTLAHYKGQCHVYFDCEYL